MKQVRLSIPVLRLAICALLITSANQSVNANENKSSNKSGAIFATSAADGGRLLIGRSPLLGYNVGVTIRIDGQGAGLLMKGHAYDRYITPGRHILKASASDEYVWQGTLDVRAGQTYSYSASFSGDKFVLTAVR